MKALKSFLAVLVLLASATTTARADAPAAESQAVMLVATDRLAGSPYEETVLLAAPLTDGGSIGFILNRPTEVKLQELFPDDAPSRKVVEPLHVGGPILANAVFAVARKAPQGNGQVIALMPGLVAVLDAASVDRVIATTPNDARYFVGLVLWEPGELSDEIRQGAWSVRPASVDTIIGGDSAGLWKDLATP